MKQQLFLALVLLVKTVKKESDARSNWQHLEHQSDMINSLGKLYSSSFLLPSFRP